MRIEAQEPLCSAIGLTPHSKYEKSVYKNGRVYVCAGYYLKGNAKLGFLITQEVYKSKGAGVGFRRFKLDENDKLLEMEKLEKEVDVFVNKLFGIKDA